jgi:putative oxidoreductase
MLEQVKPYGALAGRILLAPIFLLSGAMKIMHWNQTADEMAVKGMVAVPFFLALAVLFELGGGLSVLLGYKARLGALALALFLIPVTLVFHDFWTHTGKDMENQMQHFLKNLTIMGGLLTLAAAGAGRFSLDALTCRTVPAGEQRASTERRAALVG